MTEKINAQAFIEKLIPREYKEAIDMHQQNNPECKSFTIIGLQHIKKEKMAGVFCPSHKKFITKITYLTSSKRRGK
jgi:hypothetical protein